MLQTLSLAGAPLVNEAAEKSSASLNLPQGNVLLNYCTMLQTSIIMLQCKDVFYSAGTFRLLIICEL